MKDMHVVKCAFDLAASRNMCCAEDLDMIIEVVSKLPEGARVVQLGAGSGTMALAVFGANRKVRLTTVDLSVENLGWEGLALRNAGVYDTPVDYTAIHSLSTEAGRDWKEGPVIDFLIIDADHGYVGVRTDLVAWIGHLKPRAGKVMLHDYDGTFAPEQYPGVQRAAHEFFRRVPDEVKGWSCLYYNDVQFEPQTDKPIGK